MVEAGIGTLLIVVGVVIGILATFLFQARYKIWHTNKKQLQDEASTNQMGSQGDEETGNRGDAAPAVVGDNAFSAAANVTQNINKGKEQPIINDTSVKYEDDGHLKCPQNLRDAKEKRDRLPSIIILVRHGESEGNADHTLYRTKPDNLVELTEKGMKQAHKAGKRVEKIFHTMDLQKAQEEEQRQQNNVEKEGAFSAAVRRMHLIISPFERTRQTAAAMRPWFAHRIVRTNLEPRIREQEFANLQGNDFGDFRKEQKRVGRFWYRFPTGESGSDVYDRVKSWWQDDVMNVNERYGYEHVDAMVVVTHGLTMRFVLMQLFQWSPTTFHSVWNADNCNIYVLRKDLSKPGPSPYVFDEQAGDAPKSSIDLKVEFDGAVNKVYKLHDYLKVPPPRTRHLNEVKTKLEEQYPEVDKEHISSVVFLPFIDGAVAEQRTKTGRRASLGTLDTSNRTNQIHGVGGRQERQKKFHHANSDDLGGFCPHPELYAQQEQGWH